MLDCLIVGGGPAGFSAAIALRSRNKNVAVLSGGESALVKAASIDNMIGMPPQTGEAMLRNFRKHAERAGAQLLEKKAANIMPMGNSFMVNAGGDILEARSLILAAGAAKGKPLAGEDEFLGRGVSYCATCDGMLFRQKTCVVSGTAGDIVHEANFLAEIGVKVLFVSMKKPDGLRGDITHITGAVKSITGESAVTAVTLINGEALACDGVFLLRNAIAPDKLVPDLALENGYIQVNRQMETNIKGIFAAGDCTGAPLQVAKAIGEGHIAGLAVASYLDSLHKKS